MKSLNQRGPGRRRAGAAVLVVVAMLLGGFVAAPGASAQEKLDPQLDITYYLTVWGMEQYCKSEGGTLVENPHVAPNSGDYLCLDWFGRVILQCSKDHNKKHIWRYFCINNDWFAIPVDGQGPTAPPSVGGLAEPDEPDDNVVTDAGHIIMSGVVQELPEGSAESDDGAGEADVPAPRDTTVGVVTKFVSRP